MTYLKLMFLGTVACFSIQPALAKEPSTSLDCFKSTSTGKWLNKLDPATFLGASESGPDKMQTQKPWPLSVSTTPDGTVSVKTGGKLEKKDASPLDVEISHVFAKGDTSNRFRA